MKRPFLSLSLNHAAFDLRPPYAARISFHGFAFMMFAHIYFYSFV